MPLAPPRYCTRCRKAHTGRCPQRQQWEGSGKGRGGRGWRRTRQQVFERDGYLCQIHLARGQLVSVSLHGANHGVCDHKVPLAHGGTDDLENLQTICQVCDRDKTAAERLGRTPGGLESSGDV